MLEDIIKSLEQLKTSESSELAFSALRRYTSRPAAIFYRYDTIELLQSSVRLLLNDSHQKADEYAASLDEIRARD